MDCRVTCSLSGRVRYLLLEENPKAEGDNSYQHANEKWEHERDASFAAVLLSAIALTRQPEAIDLLIQLVETDSPAAPAAIAALGSAGLPPELRSRIAEAVERSGNARLSALLDKQLR